MSVEKPTVSKTTQKSKPAPKQEETTEVVVAPENLTSSVSETVVSEEPTPVQEPEMNEEIVEEDDSDFEAMARRGRKSKAEIEALKAKAKESFEILYGNMIAKEPAKADLYRQELIYTLKSKGLL